MIEVVPFLAVNNLRLGGSLTADCVVLFGEPRTTHNRERFTELSYSNFTARFEKSTGLLRELTLLPPECVLVRGIVFDWRYDSLLQLCSIDEKPLLVVGFVVLRTLGLAVTGVHDDDSSQMALTVFSEGAFDSLLARGKEFPI